VKILVVAVLVALAVLQQPARPVTQPVDLERAYRANNRGVALLEQFNYDAAAVAFREALQVLPDMGIAQVNLGIALFYGGKNPEAAAAARAAAGRLPESPTSHYVAGLIAKADNRLDDGSAAFERVLQLDPTDAGAKIQLGQIRTQERRYADAVQLFQEALTAEPYNVTAAYSLALALTRAGRPDEGRQAMQRFDALRSSAYGVTYAQVYLSQGRYAEALTSTGIERPLVNRAIPAVSFRDVSADILPATAINVPTSQTSGGVTLFDADGDGSLDILDVGTTGARLFRKDGRVFTDLSAQTGLGSVRLDAGAGAVAGDYDNDMRPDLLLFGERGYTLLHQTAEGAFEDVTAAAALPRPSWPPVSVAFADIDHDGDLDIVAAGTAVQMLRNNGNGTFTDITAATGVGAPLGGRAIAVAPTDFDNRRDLDLLIASAARGPLLYRNMRDGTFRDASAETALSQTEGFLSLAIGDANKDGYPDIFLGRRGPGVLALSDGRGRFRTVAVPGEDGASVAAQFVDYDNDGLLDLFTLSDRGARIFRNIGGDGWSDTSTAARLGALAPLGGAAFQSMAIGDLDGDGDDDVVIRESNGRVRAWRNDGDARNASLRVRLAGRVSNRSALGAKVELRAGSLRQTLETSSSSPAAAPADLIFGLGFRTLADAVRVLWPSGILQAETPDAGAKTRTSPLTITELDRKPSSCPYLFTWNGTRFEFVTDFMGGGEMGDWVAPSVWNQPDPDEYVRISGDQLKPRDGRYELRITNELEEALFVDRLQLVAVDHRADRDVYPNEGLRQVRQPFRLTSTRDARPPVHAVDEHGHDVLARIASLDRRYADDVQVLPIRGYAAPHALTLDLGPVAGNAVLLMTGWTDYAFSNDNVAASQGRIEMAPPSLQVKDASGAWRTVIGDVGFPVGRPQTIAVDLAGKFLSSSREIRIVTNMRIYWDQILVAAADRRGAPQLARLDPIVAQLRWRGFSRETTPDGREPFAYDYERVSDRTPWKALVGRYTREGDVRALLRSVDDMFVISRPGDEIAVSFDARSLPSLRAGWTRTFLLHADGYSKEMNPRSASPDTVGPLPFRAMTKYPYGPDEHYPDTAPYRDYLARYNTRVVNRSVPSIEAAIPPR
jgi:tetratricopeptide (TPR) repeat protein